MDSQEVVSAPATLRRESAESVHSRVCAERKLSAGMRGAQQEDTQGGGRREEGGERREEGGGRLRCSRRPRPPPGLRPPAPSLPRASLVPLPSRPQARPSSGG